MSTVSSSPASTIVPAKCLGLARVTSPETFTGKAIEKLLRLYFEEAKNVKLGEILPISTSIGQLPRKSCTLTDPVLYVQVRSVTFIPVDRIEEKVVTLDKQVEEPLIYLFSASVNTTVYLSTDEVNAYKPSVSPRESLPLLENYVCRLTEWLRSFQSLRSKLLQDESYQNDDDDDDDDKLREQSSGTSGIIRDNLLHSGKMFCNNNELWPTCLIEGCVGSGKYSLCKEFALRMGLNFYCVNLVHLIGDTSAFTIAKLSAIIHKVKTYSPCLLVMKNIHLLGRDKEGQEDKRVMLGFIDLLQDINQTYEQTKRKGPSQQEQPLEIYIIGLTDSIQQVSQAVHDSFIFKLSMEPIKDSEEIVSYLQWMIQRQPNLRLAEDFHLQTWVGNGTAKAILKYLGDLKAFLALTVREAYSEATGEPDILELDSSEADARKEGEEAVPLFIPACHSLPTTTFCHIFLSQEHFDYALGALENDVRLSVGSPKIPQVKWEDVGGLGQIKSELINSVQLPLRFPHLFTSGLKRSGILLYGPPGTGKTLLAKAVASEFKINFLSVKGPELLNMYVGQSEENVREVFDKARDCAPCVLFFDELDSLAPNRGKSGDSGGVMDRVVSQILAEMDGTHSTPNVFIIGATNRPDLIDPALLRPGRFDKLLHVGITEEKGAIESILLALTRKFNLSSNVDLKILTEKLPLGLSGADLYSFCSDAFMNAISRRVSLIEEGLSEDVESEVIVSEEDFIEALKRVSASLSALEINKYNKMKTSV